MDVVLGIDVSIWDFLQVLILFTKFPKYHTLFPCFTTYNDWVHFSALLYRSVFSSSHFCLGDINCVEMFCRPSLLGKLSLFDGAFSGLELLIWKIIKDVVNLIAP